MKNLPTFLLLICYFLPVSAGNYSYTSTFKKLQDRQSLTDQVELTILSLNTWGLPVKLPKYHQNKRFKKIPHALNKANTDIICLQECFSQSLRKNILNNISNSYSYFSDYNCNRGSVGILKMDCYGGLMTLSKHPIIEESYYPFPELEGTNLIEKIGNKGFLISLIDVGFKQIYVINTHLYSGHSDEAEIMREQQINYMWQMLDDMEILHQDLVLAGDLNFSHPKVMSENHLVSRSSIYNRLISDYGFIDGNKKEQYTIDPITNDYCNSKDGQQILDYILLRSSLNKEAYLSSKVIMNSDNAVSDHCGILAHLILEPSIETFNNELTSVIE